ncbi:MAG TPA: glycosyltransferase [Polyangia bacterium]|nr:glycosyltransferase [Polyangia bacterium]
MTGALPRQESLPVPLLPFPVPVHFVFRGRKGAWPELFDGSSPLDPDAIPHRIVEVEECWIAQTYLRLRQAGLSVTISDSFRDDAINVVSYHDLAVRDFAVLPYIVAVQQDAARPEICDRNVVQNELNVHNANDHFIPHWSQPGLIPRDVERGSRIESIAFKGSQCNLYEPFRSPAFLSELRGQGVELSYDVKENATRSEPQRWHDYSTSDVVLAVRDATEEDLKLKPASKLVNAWLAGCPALLGPEPAFRALRRGELDYIEVRSPEDVQAAVRKLRQDPSLYQAMVRNGRERGADFTPQRITAAWHRVLAYPAAQDFAILAARGRLLRRLTRWVSFLQRAPLHMLNRRSYVKLRDHGFRPISNRTT